MVTFRSFRLSWGLLPSAVAAFSLHSLFVVLEEDLKYEAENGGLYEFLTPDFGRRFNGSGPQATAIRPGA